MSFLTKLMDVTEQDMQHCNHLLTLVKSSPPESTEITRLVKEYRESTLRVYRYSQEKNKNPDIVNLQVEIKQLFSSNPAFWTQQIHAWKTELGSNNIIRAMNKTDQSHSEHCYGLFLIFSHVYLPAEKKYDPDGIALLRAIAAESFSYGYAHLFDYYTKYVDLSNFTLSTLQTLVSDCKNYLTHYAPLIASYEKLLNISTLLMTVKRAVLQQPVLTSRGDMIQALDMLALRFLQLSYNTALKQINQKETRKRKSQEEKIQFCEQAVKKFSSAGNQVIKPKAGNADTDGNEKRTNSRFRLR